MRKRAPEGIKKGTPSGHEDSRKVPQAYKIFVVMQDDKFAQKNNKKGQKGALGGKQLEDFSLRTRGTAA